MLILLAFSALLIEFSNAQCFGDGCGGSSLILAPPLCNGGCGCGGPCPPSPCFGNNCGGSNPIIITTSNNNQCCPPPCQTCAPCFGPPCGRPPVQFITLGSSPCCSNNNFSCCGFRRRRFAKQPTEKTETTKSDLIEH